MKLKAILMAILLPCWLLAAKADRDWKTGKIMAARTVNTGAVAGQAYPSSIGGYGPHMSPPVIARTLTAEEFEMFSGDYAYTVRDLGSGLRKRSCRYIVGDPVKYSQDKSILLLIDADGRECRGEVMIQERLPTDIKPAVPPAPPAPKP